MPTATIITSRRAPNGRLKGYELLVDNKQVYLSCEEIKDQIRSNALIVEGMTINSAGALIPKSKDDGSTGKKTSPEQVRITSILEPYQKNYREASKKNGPAGKNVAFVKRRIT